MVMAYLDSSEEHGKTASKILRSGGEYGEGGVFHPEKTVGCEDAETFLEAQA